ncbi:hypothetical protein FQR65_LT15058 [Abscondita terminalis]|nr:hypothetical protein FQR65_LT15058 [Abscondita terminalis]
MPKKGIPLSRQKSSRSRSNRAKKIQASWIQRRKTRPQEIHTMNGPSTSAEGRTNSPPLHNLEAMSNETFATTTQLNKDPWGTDAEYEEIMANELEAEVSQPNEPPISGKKIVNIASLLQRVIKVSENHARTCTTGSLSIDKEIRRGLESTIVR